MNSTASTSGTKTLLRDLTTLPNLLSLSRVFLAALAIFGLGVGEPQLVFWPLVGSAGIDALDGFLARKLDQVTELGAILDRATDLMMEAVALFAVAVLDLMPFWVYFVYLFREFTVTSLRMYMAQIKAPIPKSTLGQRKTNFLMTGFGFLYGGTYSVVPLGATQEPIIYAGIAMIVIGLLLSYGAMLKYIGAFARSYRDIKN